MNWTRLDGAWLTCLVRFWTHLRRIAALVKLWPVT